MAGNRASSFVIIRTGKEYGYFKQISVLVMLDLSAVCGSLTDNFLVAFKERICLTALPTMH
jgi:hypothetical protein